MEWGLFGVVIVLIAALYFAARKGGKSAQRNDQLEDNADVRKEQDAVPDMSDAAADDWLRGKGD